jgi:hypothetical protein
VWFRNFGFLYTGDYGQECWVLSKEYRWQAGNLIDELEPGETLKDGATNWVKGANKIKVQIIRVHYTDGTVCK